jgi:hypothetical protein
MTQEEIIEMVKLAGFEEHQAKFDTRFEPFAKLVAEKEREACAKACEEVWLDTVEAQTHNDKCVKAIRARK